MVWPNVDEVRAVHGDDSGSAEQEGGEGAGVVLREEEDGDGKEAGKHWKAGDSERKHERGICVVRRDTRKHVVTGSSRVAVDVCMCGG